MAVSGRETWDSRNVTISPQSPDSVLKYFIQGTYDPEEVNTWLIANVPLLYGVLWLQDFKIEPQGGGCWFVDANYGDARRDGLGKPDGTPLDAQGIESEPPAEPTRPQDTDNLGPEFSFEIVGEPVHIKQSFYVIDQIARGWNTGQVPPDCKQAIGLSTDGIEGVEKEYGILRISETRKMRSITRKYLDTLRSMSFKVCDAKGFWGFKQREVRFDGASGQGHNDGTWTITYRFSVRENRKDVVVSPEITFPFVKGWDYIDVKYGNTVDEDILMRIPEAAYVHVIYEEADFSKLGIGK